MWAFILTFVMTWPFLIPGNVFWPYFAGVVLLAIGLFAVGKEMSQARGLDRITVWGRVFFAMPMAVFAAQHFTATKFIVLVMPSWIPVHRFWVYFVGLALIAAALSITLRLGARLAATLLGIMLVLFVLLIHIPRVAANPADRIAWAVALRDLAFSGGAWCFAGAQTRQWRSHGAHALITLGRFLIAIPTVFFGIEGLLHPLYVPGVPLEKITPEWIPGHVLWGYLAGVVLIGCGAGLLVRQQVRLLATLLGVMIFVLVLFVYLPIVVAAPSDIANGLNYFVDTLMYSGAALMLAEATSGDNRPRA